jgi:hypothetical protein
MSCFKNLANEIIDIICSFLSLKDIINLLFLTSKDLSSEMQKRGFRPTCYNTVFHVNRDNYTLGKKIFFRNIHISEYFADLKKFLKIQGRSFDGIFIELFNDESSKRQEKVFKVLQEKSISKLLLGWVVPMNINLLFLNNLKVTEHIELFIRGGFHEDNYTFMFPSNEIQSVTLRCTKLCKSLTKYAVFNLLGLNTRKFKLQDFCISDKIIRNILDIKNIKVLELQDCIFSEITSFPSSINISKIEINNNPAKKLEIPIKNTLIFREVNLERFISFNYDFFFEVYFILESYINELVISQPREISIISEENLSVQNMSLSCDQRDFPESKIYLKNVKVQTLRINEVENISLSFNNCVIETLKIETTEFMEGKYCEIVLEKSFYAENIIILSETSNFIIISGDEDQKQEIKKIVIVFKCYDNKKKIILQNLKGIELEVKREFEKKDIPDSCSYTLVKEKKNKKKVEEMISISFISCEDIVSRKYYTQNVSEEFS